MNQRSELVDTILQSLQHRCVAAVRKGLPDCPFEDMVLASELIEQRLRIRWIHGIV